MLDYIPILILEYAFYAPLAASLAAIKIYAWSVTLVFGSIIRICIINYFRALHSLST